jgi:hypothetical protein
MSLFKGGKHSARFRGIFHQFIGVYESSSLSNGISLRPRPHHLQPPSIAPQVPNLMAASLISSYYPEARPGLYAPVFVSSNSLDIGATDRRDAMLAL